MKKYTVKVNTERRKFFTAQWETVGSVKSQNQNDAIRKVYDAVWGIENDAVITARGETLQYCTRSASFKAEIE